jgi:hypothetical protein
MSATSCGIDSQNSAIGHFNANFLSGGPHSDNTTILSRTRQHRLDASHFAQGQLFAEHGVDRFQRVDFGALGSRP